MKQLNKTLRYAICLCINSAFLFLLSASVEAQTCPSRTTTSLANYDNTYYPATQASVAAGSYNITLGAAGYGSTQITAGDLVLIIQMQGASLNFTNTSSYGSGTSGVASGYYSNSVLLAGNMEFIIATSSVPLAGGTLSTLTPLKYSYQNSAFGTYGQYTYQIIRVPMYFNLKLTGTVTAPAWNGTSGGLVVLYAVDSLYMNGQTIDASGMGFRGGGGRQLSGAGSGSNADYITLSSANANGSKGEGIAGTPKYINNGYASLTINSVEGYPSGSYARGAPGNAGGGGTDGNPKNSNDQNSGGGGGGNGGAGGVGGNSWSSNLTVGGVGGAAFGQKSASRLVMGGGGGAGTTNNGTGTPNGGVASSGAPGGGIVIVYAYAISGTGSILANGTDGGSTVQNDGSGGGGAGGSIMIYSQKGGTGNITASAKGGAGGRNQITATDPHGPGGGGGGGVIYSASSLSSTTITGGAAGLTNQNSSTYGATVGTDGTSNTSVSASSFPSVIVSCQVLATTFIDIAANRQDDATSKITWDVADEANVLQYQVEKSTDGTNFSTLGTVTYRYSSTGSNTYTYTDAAAAKETGTLYYRVLQVATDGSKIYSKIVSLRAEGSMTSFFIFPNPVRSTATVHFDITTSETVSLRLYDSKGSNVWAQSYQVEAGQHDVSIDKAGSLANGIYILQLTDGQTSKQIKVLVNH